MIARLKRDILAAANRLDAIRPPENGSQRSREDS
jgi:hypothetical protein